MSGELVNLQKSSLKASSTTEEGVRINVLGFDPFYAQRAITSGDKRCTRKTRMRNL